MKVVALALRDLAARIGGWFGVEGAFLVAGAVLLSVWAYHLDPNAPWAIVGGLCIAAWLALIVRR